MRGYVQVYTGDGKGKTTAAVGLALRAAAAGLRVYIGQFLKKRPTGEIVALQKRVPGVTTGQFGTGRFIKGTPTAREIAAARSGFDKLRSVLLNGKHDVVIADEINNAGDLGLIGMEDVASLVKEKPRNVELVLTGRSAHPLLIEMADLVTEMQSIKHYMDKGIKARRGIEE